MKKTELLKEIVQVADYLDAQGMSKEADVMDGIMKKVADSGDAAAGGALGVGTGLGASTILHPAGTAFAPVSEIAGAVGVGGGTALAIGVGSALLTGLGLGYLIRQIPGVDDTVTNLMMKLQRMPKADKIDMKLQVMQELQRSQPELSVSERAKIAEGILSKAM